MWQCHQLHWRWVPQWREGHLGIYSKWFNMHKQQWYWNHRKRISNQKGLIRSHSDHFIRKNFTNQKMCNWHSFTVSNSGLHLSWPNVIIILQRSCNVFLLWFFPTCDCELWPMTLTQMRSRWNSMPISRSKVISFKSYHLWQTTDTHTRPSALHAQ